MFTFKSPLRFTDSSRTLYLVVRLWQKITKRRRLQLVFLIFLMITSSLSELFTLVTVIPFLTILTNPQDIFKNSFVKYLASRLEYTSPCELLVPITLMFVACIILSTIIRLSNLWLSARLASLIGTDLSCESYRRTPSAILCPSKT